MWANTASAGCAGSAAPLGEGVSAIRLLLVRAAGPLPAYRRRAPRAATRRAPGRATLAANTGGERRRHVRRGAAGRGAGLGGLTRGRDRQSVGDRKSVNIA